MKMEKFLKICSGLKSVDNLTYKKVNSWLLYMQFEINKNKYFPAELIKIRKQQTPSLIIELL